MLNFTTEWVSFFFFLHVIPIRYTYAQIYVPDEKILSDFTPMQQEEMSQMLELSMHSGDPNTTCLGTVLGGK